MEKPDWLKLSFAEAIDFFRNKKNVQIDKWDDLTSDQYDYSFGIAGMMEGDLLDDIRSVIDDMLAEGIPYEQVESRIVEAMATKGWVSSQGEEPSPRRIYIIADTNVRQSYRRGNIKQFEDSGGKDKYPYFIWRHRDSEDYRPHHKELHNKAIPVDSEFARECFPPHGFGCRCKGQFANERIINALGAEIISPPDWKEFKEKGFGGLKTESLEEELINIKQSK